jgi:hypothetical protein
MGWFSMSITTQKKRARTILSRGQNRLLKESLKQLLGQGLLQTYSQSEQREEKALFLKEAFNSKILDPEWLA